MEAPCPRCKSPGFVRVFAEKGYCWWCSQEKMTAVCVGDGKGCGMRVCESCLSGKLPKALPLLPPSSDDPPPMGQEEFTI